jgi:hypothetical protein
VPTIPVIQIGTQLAGDGSVSAPSIAFASDPDTGFYKLNSGEVGFSSNNGLKMVFRAGGLLMDAGVILSWNDDVSLSRAAAGTLTLNSTTATPAGGSTAMRLAFGSTAGFGIYIGSGAPTVSAAQGSLYLRSDGSSASTRAYINTNGTTGWTAITTAA